MKWRDALRELTDIIDAPDAGEKIRGMMEAETAHRKPTKPPKYKVGDTVQTTYTAWPTPQTTIHTVQRIWTREEGYTGPSGYAYQLQPPPRGSNHRPLDEGWLTAAAKPTTNQRKP